MSDSFQLKAIITGVDKLTPTMRRMNKQYQAALNEMQAKTRAQRSSAVKMTENIALGTVGAMTAVSAAFAKQETAATDLKISMMNASGSVGVDFDKLNKKAVEFGNKLPGSTADFQEMMQTLVSQGVPAQKILDGVGEAAANLAVVLHEAPKEAALQMAQLQDATKATGEQILNLSDMGQRMAFLGVSMDSTVSYFSSASSALQLISKDGEAAARALAPLTVELSNASIEAGAAGNATRKMMNATLNTKKINQANHALKKHGIHLNFVSKQGKFLGIKNFIAQVEKLNKLSDTARTAALGKIFGDDAETISALMAVMKNGVKGYEEIQKKMQDQASLNQRVDSSLDTLTNKFDAMKGSAENAAASIGKVFAPQMKDATGYLNDFSVALDDGVKKYPKAAREFGDVAVSITGVAVALRAVKFAMGLLALNPYTATILALAGAAGYLIANREELSQIYDKNKKTSKTAAAAQKVTKKYAFGETKKVEPLVYDPFGFNRPRSPQTSGMGIMPTGEINKLIPYGLFDKVKGFASDVGISTGAFPYALTNRASAPGYNYGGDVNLLGGGQKLIQSEMVVRFENAPPGMRVSEVKTNAQNSTVRTDVGYSPYSLMRGNY